MYSIMKEVYDEAAILAQKLMSLKTNQKDPI
jgi:hypothetical protein